MPTDTIKRLAEITDAALFERIASDVLRSVDPKYCNLAHPGVNADGKTVKAPLDNIGWIQSADGSRLIGVEHTTVEQQDLKGKWLHNPATVTPRKAGGKATQPAGDLVKAISIVEAYRATQPWLAATLVLTTNRETPADVRVSVESLAASANIDLDVWCASKIAHILDTTPHGQIIRQIHLGTAIELVSVQLLLQMGTQSISDHLLLPSENEIVVRGGISIDAGHVLVAGDSGMGKTTNCATFMQQHIDAGLPGIVLKHEYIATSTTIEEALERELRRQNAEIESGAGSKALSMSSTDSPFLFLVEDINRSDNPTAILEKVIGWALQESKKQGKEHGSSWRLVCPVWPRYLESFLQRKDVFSIFNLVYIGSYDDEEGQKAITKRAAAENQPMDEYRAAAIAKRLGNDPLLISLHDLKNDLNASDVIEQHVSTKLANVASRIRRFSTEVESVVLQLMLEMLSRRKLNPSWLEAITWSPNSESTNILREVVSDGGVLRFSGTGEQVTIHARHDRIMHFLMAKAVADRLEAGDLTSEYLHDPFFAESVGAGVVKSKLPIASLNALMVSSPIVVFFALKTAIESSDAYKDTAYTAIENWLKLPEVQASNFVNRRFAALQVLAEINSTDIILRLTELFPKSDRHWDIYRSARFKNGDVGAGVAMLTMFEFGVTIAGRRELLAHVKRQYGNNLVKAIESLLVREDLSEKQRAGVLYLAGYIGSAISPRAIQTAWASDGPKRDLQAHLWAAAQCCGAEASETLGPVCDAWEALPEEENAIAGQPIDRLAADGISWEFRDHTPHNAVPYFVQRANQSKKLNWPITYMLRAVDHPCALEHLARWLSDRDIQSNGLSMGLVILTSDWERHFREHGRVMSPSSKRQLLKLAMDLSNSDYLRKRAFDLWELTISDGDMEIVRSIEPSNVLYSKALWARARRHDESVTEILAQILEENPAYWLQTGRYIWSEEMTAALIPIIEQISKREDDGGNDAYFAAEALDFLSPELVEKIIIPHWEGLKFKSVFVQKLLQIATPKLLGLVHQAITQSDSPKDLFKYFTVRIRTRNHKGDGLSRLEQMEALQPYLKMLELHDIESLWKLCAKHGWLNFRVSHLDPLLQQQPERNIYLPGDSINTDDLDRALKGTLMAIHRWIDMQIERGAERATVFQSMLAWLEKHQEVRALCIVSDIFSETANREEFELLLLAAKHRLNSKEILDATKFNVFRRSLV